MAVISPVSDEAFADLYARHRRQVYAFCLRWLRSREEAEDAVQTTFMYAWRGLRRGVVPVSESAWMLAITRNVCLSATDAGRRRAAEVARDPHVLEESVAVAAAPDADAASLSRALSELTDSQRRAIVMREWQGLSYKEISEELGLSQSAVETLLFRARQSLARKLKRVTGLAPWLKSLLGGGAAKIALGTTVVVIGAAAAGEVATPHSPAARLPRAHVASRVAPSRGAAVPVAQSTAIATPHRAAAAPHAGRSRPTVAAALAPAAAAPASVPSAPSPPSASAESAAQPAPTAAPSTPVATSRPVAPPGDNGNTVVNPVTNPATTATDTATNSVNAAASTVTDTATNTVNGAAGTVAATATTIANTIVAAGTQTAGAAVGTVTNAAPTAASTAVTSVTSALPSKLTP